LLAITLTARIPPNKALAKASRVEALLIVATAITLA
jgi:hypothetical protein